MRCAFPPYARYWEHTVRDDDDFARHLDYIHFNPYSGASGTKPLREPTGWNVA